MKAGMHHPHLQKSARSQKAKTTSNLAILTVVFTGAIIVVITAIRVSKTKK
jgi:hypothetical protein